MHKNNVFALLNDDNNEDNVENKEVDVLNTQEDTEAMIHRQYYSPKKNYRNNKKFYKKNNNNNIDDDGFIKVIEPKKPNTKYEEINIDNILDKSLKNNYKLLIHYSNKDEWNYNTYHSVKEIKTWNDLFGCLYTFKEEEGEKKYYDFNTYLMRDNIYPMWEHPDNRFGSVCSIRVDSLEEAYSVFEFLSINFVNHTLLTFSEDLWNIVNGISYSPKTKGNYESSPCVIIKIWFKRNFTKEGGADKYLHKDVKTYLEKYISKYPIKTSSIKPEY